MENVCRCCSEPSLLAWEARQVLGWQHWGPSPWETLPATPSSAGAEPVVADLRVFSGRRKPCQKAHPLRTGIPVASLLFILQTPQELIFHAISAENSHGRTTIWRSGWWGRACLCSRLSPPPSPRLPVPGALGPGQAFFWDRGLEE